MDSIEIQEILVSVLAIAFAFSLVFMGNGLGALTDQRYPVFFLMTLMTVGLGFVLHELAHRHIARRYGAHAIFQAWPIGLMLMVGLAVIGSPVIFAAPGAVVIYASHISREENGIISVAGPLTNLALAIAFGFGAIGLASAASDFGQLAHFAFIIGFQVNVFLALFNLIPIFPLDGSKVFDWDRRVWGAVVAFALVLMVLAPRVFVGLASPA